MLTEVLGLVLKSAASGRRKPKNGESSAGSLLLKSELSLETCYTKCPFHVYRAAFRWKRTPAKSKVTVTGFGS